MVKKTKRRINKKRLTQKKRGGNILLNKTGFVGTPWGPNPSQWPRQHDGNWYTLNSYKTNPGYHSLPSNIKGGKRKKKKGGTLLLSDISYLSKGLGYNFNSLLNSITTAPPPMNPAPYYQPKLGPVSTYSNN